MATIFKIRRDTASNWASENTVLSAGEMGLDQTNNFIKMGDGTTAWNALAQFTQNIENVEDLVGAMFASNTETFISVTYNDSDGSVDFVVPVLDEDNLASNSATNLATQQSIKAYVDAQFTASDLDFIADSGGALSIDLDSETLTIAGGTGIDSVGSGNGVTMNIDSTVATLAGSQTLTNKTVEGATMSGTTAFTGAATTNSTFDGRDVATDGTKLDGIEASATADQTAAQIKTAYEGETSAFTDAQFSKLAAIEASATADQSNAEIRAAVEAASDSNVFTNADHTKLNAVEASADVTDTANVVAALSAGTGIGLSASGVISAGALAVTTVQTASSQSAHLALTAEQGDVVVRSDENKSYIHNGGSAGNMTDYTLLATPTDSVLSVNGVTGAITAAHIATAVEAASGSNTFTDADHTKLGNIETAADVTDATNVTAAGALMDSELAGLAAVKATTGTFLTADQTKLDGIETSATADQTAAQIKAAYEGIADTNAHTDAQVTKLAGIETSATADQTSADIRGLVAIDEDNMSSDSATKLPTQQSVKAYVDTQVATVPVGDITSVVAGTGLTGGGTSGDVTVNVIGGTGITANADDIAIDSTVATLTGTQTMSAKTLTSPVFNTGVSGSAILDEDNFASNSATKIATQQSIKAYVDAAILTEDNTDEIVEGSSNLYHTTARARASISVTDSGGDGSLAYNSTSGVVTYTGPSAAEARAHISVTDAGGDGSAAYNSSTGVITYTGPSAAEVRAHLSAGTGVTYSGGAFSIGQAVATDSDVTFDDVVVSGNLTINGTTTTAASTNTTIADKLIELGNGQSGSPSGDLGLVFERGSSANAFIGFDESTDKFTVGTGTFTGASTGNLSITTGTLVANIEAATVVTTGNITVGGTVDGRDMQTDGTKLDAIEASATADQTGAQIKTLYQAESSAFTDSQFSKLANIETAADVTDATNVNAAGAVMLSDATTSGMGFVIDEDNLVSDHATKVPTQQSVKAYVDTAILTVDSLAEMSGTMDDIANGSTFVKTNNNFSDVEKASLATMEDSADVTDAANVEAAGAVMESGANASAKIPNGSTAQRDSSPSAGFFRWNTTTSSAEIYDGSAWGLVGGGNTTDKVMWEHSYTVSSNYEIANGNNAITSGPITINSGASVTVPSGSSWAII